MDTIKSDQVEMLICRCFIKNGTGQILFIQRHPLSRYSPNLWEVPGGKTEPDEEPMEALAREVLEETGLTIEVDSGFVHQECRIVPDGPRAGQQYTGLFSVGRVTGGELNLSSEHADAVWLHLHELDTIAATLTPGVRRALDNIIPNS